MKKSIVALCIGFIIALADESGFFVGGGIGVHSASGKVKTKITYIYDRTISNSDTQTQSESDTSLSLILGYKNMMDTRFGVRFYLNYDHNMLDLKQTSGKSVTKPYKIIGLNGDYLYNFNDILGAFVGANLGLISWDKQMWSFEPSKDSERWDEYFAVQFGLRAFKGRHSLEFGVKIPLTTMSVAHTNPNIPEFRQMFEQQGLNPADFNTEFEVKLKQQYNAFLRYIFSF